MADQRTQVVITAKDETSTGVNGAIANIGRIGGAYTGLVSPITGAVAAIGAATAKLAADFKGAIDTGDQLNKLSQKTGIAVEKLSELAYAGDLADINLESLATGIKKLSVNMAEAATNTNSKAAEAFKALGISVKDANGNLRSSDEVMADIADRFANMKDGAGKTALAIAILGKAGADLIPFFNMGSRGMAEMADEAKKLGLVMTGDTAKAAEEFNDNLRKLSLSASALGRSIAADTLPWLVRMTDEMVEARRQGIGLAEGIRQLGTRGTNPQTNIRNIDQEVASLRTTMQRDPDATNPTVEKAYKEKIAELERARAYYVARANSMALAGAAKLGDVRDARDLMLATAKTEAPAIKGDDNEAAKAEKRKRLARPFDPEGDFLAKLDQAQFDAGKKAAIESERAAQKETEATERLRQNYINLADPLQKYRVQLDEINKLRADGKLSAAQALEAEWQVNEAMGETAKKMMGIKDVGTDTFAELTRAIEGWGNKFTDTLADAVMTGKANFADLANSILRDLVRIQIQQRITEPLIGSRDKPGLLTAGFNALFDSFGGARAGGGNVDPSKFYLVGENGPELFSPGASGSIIPNNAIGGGSSLVVNIIEDASRGGQVQRRTDGQQNVLDVFVDRVKSAIAGDIARGSGAVPSALESTYGMNRAAGAY